MIGLVISSLRSCGAELRALLICSVSLILFVLPMVRRTCITVWGVVARGACACIMLFLGVLEVCVSTFSICMLRVFHIRVRCSLMPVCPVQCGLSI